MFPLASPAHIIGSTHPQVAQPSKILFPKPPVEENFVLNHLDTLRTGREAKKDYLVTSKSGKNQQYNVVLILLPKLNLLAVKFQISGGR